MEDLKECNTIKTNDVAKSTRKVNWIIVFTVIFIFLNIVNSYFLTTSLLNQYIVEFDRTFFSELCSILGNISVLLFISLVALAIFRKAMPYAISLTVITLALNIVIFALGFYSKNYKTMFSIYNFMIMRNPSGGFTSHVVADAIRELFTYYRIILFIPFVIMLTLVIVFRKKILHKNVKMYFVRTFLAVLGCLAISVLTIFTFKTNLEKKWEFSTEVSLFGCQYAGVYNYYASEFVYRADYRLEAVDGNDFDNCEEYLLEYNKNKDSYVNFIDGKTYSKLDNQTGLFKDRNLFIIHLESTQDFVYNTEFNGNVVTPNFNKLITDPNCVYFDNVYTTSGMGTTSDAEFGIFTGYVASGTSTIYWDYADHEFSLTALPRSLGSSYKKYSYHSTIEEFYNRKMVHPGLLGFDRYTALETYQSMFSQEEYPYNYITSWVSDEELLNWALKDAVEIQKTGLNTLSFCLTITPHNPFDDLSGEYEEEKNYEKLDWGDRINNSYLGNYLDQVHYNDKMIYEFVMKAKDILDDPVFLFYGDHGNAVAKGEYVKLMGDLTDIEYRKILANIPVMIYDPSGDLAASLEDGFDSTRVLSQRDLFRTLTNLFDVYSDTPIYGVNMLSLEPSYSYDPKNVDIFLDNLTYSLKNSDYEGNTDDYVISDHDLDVINMVAQYKFYQDLFLYRLVNESPERKSE